MGVNRPIEKYDVVYSYRGYFNRLNGEIPPETDYNIHFSDDGNVGFHWLVTEFDRIDVLVCRFYKPDDAEILATLKALHEENPHMGLDLVYGGTHDIIPVCQPLALLVTDGYAAVGDSAFMTVALKGSGLAYSIKAGKILADTVIADTNCCYNQETLWDYQRRFFKEIGIGAGGIAILKNMLPYITANDINKIFAMKLVTTEELTSLFENKADAVFNAKGISALKSKIRKVSDEPILKTVLGNLAVWLTKYAVLQASFPNKYDKKDALEWNEKYNKFFESIKRKD
jgi:flavin-dependent dehydrogenase